MAVLASLSAAAPLAAITVVVDGVAVPPSPPAIERGGRVLLPMRVTFEALGAEVKWQAATQTATAVRGDTTVRMTIGSDRAYVDDQEVLLAVPPQLIGGSTYIPVRFPAEAFGCDVQWVGATQTVLIKTPQEAPPPPPPPAEPEPAPKPVEPPPPPPPPPPPAPAPTFTTTEGVVVAVRPQGQASIAIEADNDIRQYRILPDETILVRQGQSVALTDISPGDYAKVRHDDEDNALVVEASYESVEGKVVARVGNKLLLEDGKLVTIRPNVVVQDDEGGELALSDVKEGDTVSVRVTPGTEDAYGVIISRPAPAPPPEEPQGPEIDLFYHDAEGPLTSRDVLAVTLKGTPGGRAWFTVGDRRQRVNLTELRREPGTYTTTYRVPDGLNALGVPLLGYLEVDGEQAGPVESDALVTIDTTPPEITVVGPQEDTAVSNRTPNIAVLIDDPNGSGVDPDGSSIQVVARGRDEDCRVTQRGQLLSAVPDGLPPGDVTVTVRARDNAGNATEKVWTFRVIGGGMGGRQEIAVTHDATGVLYPGDVLTVTLTGPPGGEATFDVGDWEQDIPMVEEPGNPGRYRSAVEVPDITAVREETIRGHLRMEFGRTETAEATTPVVFGPHRQLKPVIDRPHGPMVTGDEVVVEGRTDPLAKVRIHIGWDGVWELFGKELPAHGDVTDLEVNADAKGRFRTQPINLVVGRILKFRDVKYTLTAVGVSEDGQESEPTEVTFTRHPGP
jgi:hypothetical protein